MTEAEIRADERERCARICDAEAQRLKEQIAADVWCGYSDTGAMVCANLIRTGNAAGVKENGRG